MTAEFFRKQSSGEKSDYRQIPSVIQRNTSNEIFKEKLIETEKQFTSKRKPFCFRCARMDFQDTMDEGMREYERRVGYVDFEKFKINMPDLEEYGKESRFEFVKETEIFEPANAAKGTKPHMKICKDYKCKERGCGISVFVTEEELKKETKETKEVKEK